MKKHPRAVALGCFLLYFLFPLVYGSAVGIGFKIFLTVKLHIQKNHSQSTAKNNKTIQT